MQRYDLDDIVTMYFVVSTTHYDTGMIRGYSDDKSLVKSYLEFHNCPGYKLTTLTDTWRECVKVLNECVHDEINIAYLTTKDPIKKSRRLYVPITSTEMNFLLEESQTFCVALVDYGSLSSVIDYFKPKYQKALSKLLLTDLIDAVIHGKEYSKKIQNLDVDMVTLLYRLFPESFG